MMKCTTVALSLAAILLGGCNHNQDAMQASMDALRGMIKQSAAMAAQAVCMPGGKGRADMVHAAVVLARHAMGGPEMEKIHKTMGMRPDALDGMGMGGDKDAKMSPQMQRHVALHDAGEGIFDFLDGVSGRQPLTCKQAGAVALAATAAMLREAPGVKMDEAARRLDQAADMQLQPAGAPAVKVVTNLVRALQKI